MDQRPPGFVKNSAKQEERRPYWVDKVIKPMDDMHSDVKN